MIPIFNVVLISDKDENVINNSKHFVLFHFRSSRVEMFCKKGVLRTFEKFRRIYLCQGLFFSKVAGLKPATLLLLKKRLWHGWFPVNFAKFLRTPLVAASVTYRNILINFIVTLFIRCKFKWAISVKYQLHLYLPRFQNFDFQDFLGTPYINWFLTKQHFWQKLIIKN